MAIYTTYFVCDPEALREGFPAWKPPLAEPLARVSVNPFTGERTTVTTDVPEWDDDDDVESSVPSYQATAITGDYGEYLEQRIPSFVRSQPHACLKGLTTVELQALIAVATGDSSDAPLLMPLHAHPAANACLESVPDLLTKKLRDGDEPALRRIATDWAGLMSTLDYTHNLDGDRVQNDWAIDDAILTVGEIAAVAKKGSDTACMYLLTEW